MLTETTCNRVFHPFTSDGRFGPIFDLYTDACEWLDTNDPNYAVSGFRVSPLFSDLHNRCEVCKIHHRSVAIRDSLFDTSGAAIPFARYLQGAIGQPFYVVRDHSKHNSPYVITTRMPTLGEWYTSDGIQHGTAIHA